MSFKGDPNCTSRMVIVRDDDKVRVWRCSANCGHETVIDKTKFKRRGRPKGASK